MGHKNWLKFSHREWSLQEDQCSLVLFNSFKTDLETSINPPRGNLWFKFNLFSCSSGYLTPEPKLKNFLQQSGCVKDHTGEGQRWKRLPLRCPSAPLQPSHFSRTVLLFALPQNTWMTWKHREQSLNTERKGKGKEKGKERKRKRKGRGERKP